MGQVATSELRLTGVREEAEEGSSVDHGGGDALEELQSREEVRCKHSEYRSVVHSSSGGGGVVSESSSSYSFSVRERCLPGPAPRRRSSSLLRLLEAKLGGSFTNEPEDMLDGGGAADCCRLSPATVRVLREEVFHDLEPSEVVDYHMHLVGHGDSGSGCHLHENTKTWRKPLNRLKTALFMSAAGVPDMDGGDIQYISRLVRLVKHFAPACITDPSQHGYTYGKFCLLAFDELYEKNGESNRMKTTMYIPNEYAVTVAAEFPEYFHAVGSVNPYRADALAELQRCADKGITIIKWLPNSMGIDPSEERHKRFYMKMKELDMALLSHTGEEHSVNAAYIENAYGNPLLLRRPLDCGVKVIAAHCATEGTATDIDGDGSTVPCFNLFMRLMREENYKELLFADISAVCAFRRVRFLQELVEATDIHDRLVYGSDYPVPAINLVVHTSKLQKWGLISAEHCSALNELYNYNPLLFDCASKRLLRGSGGERFPASVFKAHPALPPVRSAGAPPSTDSAAAGLSFEAPGTSKQGTPV